MKIKIDLEHKYTRSQKKHKKTKQSGPIIPHTIIAHTGPGLQFNGLLLCHR